MISLSKICENDRIMLRLYPNIPIFKIRIGTDSTDFTVLLLTKTVKSVESVPKS